MQRAAFSHSRNPALLSAALALEQPVCSRAKHPRGKGNCVANPNCVFGLGEGKEGVWAKAPLAVAHLLQHPPVRLRRGWTRAARLAGSATAHEDGGAASDGDDGDGGCSAVQPAGLNNLGATCYLNALLQTLFHCLPFRAAVYAFPEAQTATPSSSGDGGSGEGSSRGGSRGNSGGSGANGSGGNGALESCPGAAVVRELQRLFAHLDCGGAGQWADTAALVALLGFDTGYQQDPIECWKLLSATIEEAFKATVNRC
jgi:hypothetical protein